MTFILACATVIEEMVPLLPSGVGYRVLDFGLHTDPAKLRHALQKAIDEVEMDPSVDVIILGYGLCSQGVIGIKSSHSILVVPRVDDCISIFLGSASAYRNQARLEPGTYYLTKGWIEVGESPFSEYDATVQRFGREKAERIYQMMFQHYKRLALINTGQYELERYREYARRTADRFSLRYEEIEGSTELVTKMINGPWDKEFIVVEPGRAIELEQFFFSESPRCSPTDGQTARPNPGTR
jgi:hypothetical protein